MKRNVNHYTYYLGSGIKNEVPKEKPVEKKEVVEEKKKYTEDELYDMTKSEQIELLEKLGLTKKEIRALKHEDDRVDTILKLQ